MRTAIFLLVGLGACVSAPPTPLPEAPVIEQGEIETMADGRCFAFSDGELQTTIVIDETLVTPEVKATDGTVIVPAVYEQNEREVLVPTGAPRRFEVICPQNLSQSFVASVQRALKVRGIYAGAVNGLMDQGTRSSILAYQTSLGRRSANLGFDTAVRLGLIPAR